ncbi:hypothetical protein Hanom_Chr07g00608301 [Helianthus anomalus]
MLIPATAQIHNTCSQHVFQSQNRPLALTVANLLVLSFSRIGKKCADFVNRSTITQIVSWPLGVLGNFVIKSMEIYSHFHLGISGCCRSPEGFWYSALTLAHVKHLLT